MANTYVDYVGSDGTGTGPNAGKEFLFSFPYIKTSHVAVEINQGPAGGTNKWERTTDFTVETSPSTRVVLDSVPNSLWKIRVLRDSDANEGIVDFANGSVLTETELDNSYQHNRYLAEEAEEGKTGGALVKDETSGQFDADALRLENLADPDSDDDAVNKGYADNRYVDVAGDTMTGNLDMGANKVTSSATPSSGNDLTNKTYTDATFVDVAGDTMSGELNMGSNKITNLADPTVDADAANKNYVDDTITTSLATGSPPPGVQLATAQIEDDAITYAKLQNIAANNVLLGNDNGTGVDVQELTATEARTLLNVADGAEVNVQSDWNEADTGSDAFIQNKPTIPTNVSELSNDAGYTTNAGTVVSIASGTGLTGGPITSSGTLSLDSIANLRALGNVSGGAAAPTAIEIKDEDNMATASATSLATSESIKAYVDSQVVSKYTAAWDTSHGGVTVEDGATLTITHNLGTSDVIVQIYVNSAESDTGALSLDSVHEDDGGFTPGQGAVVTSIQSSNAITVQLGTNGYYSWSSSGVMTNTTFNSKYIKVVVIG